jgi:hypothetical protein
LSAGDLAGAVKVVEELPDSAAAATQAWLSDARQRLAAERAVARLTQDATARLAVNDHAATATPGTRNGER